jgi:hypothetical protein
MSREKHKNIGCLVSIPRLKQDMLPAEQNVSVLPLSGLALWELSFSDGVKVR